jgi:hypothetical protein
MFFAEWKTADAGLSVVAEAKKEYAQPQSRSGVAAKNWPSRSLR